MTSKLDTNEERGRWRARMQFDRGPIYVATGDTEAEALAALRTMMADRLAALRGDDDDE